MADSKITDLTQQSVFAFDDLLEGVDVSDTTLAASGTNKKIDLSRFGGCLAPCLCNGRLTLESGVPVSTSDQTAKTTIYFTPYNGNRIAVYDGTRWKLYAFTELTLALGTLTSGLPYDVYIYDNAGTLTLEALAWTNGTARATALVLQDGVYCKTGALTRRYLGTFYTTATTTTEDSKSKRFLWNYYNRVHRQLVSPTETANSWTYTTATFRQANANTANKVEYVSGDPSIYVAARVIALVSNDAAVTGCVAGIGVDSTSANSAQHYGFNAGTSSNSLPNSTGTYVGQPGVGYHYLAWLEYSGATGTTNWYGDAGNPTVYQAGLTAEIEA